MAATLAGRLDAGSSHTCIVGEGGRVRCWGVGNFGQLGYGNTNSIGDTEHPSTAGVVDLGQGLRAVSVAAGSEHTCALADDSAVRCWGQGYGGRLGYANSVSIGDDERPAAAGPVQLGQRVRAITAGNYHTCAILDDWTVRCWGVGFTYFGSGHLGYGNTLQIGDDETPGSVGPVDLGAGRTARAITAGSNHTCALLDTGQVRCWGSYFFGQLGVPVQQNIGDNETPGSIAPVDLGPGRTATAISAGTFHTCVILDDGSVRCWGMGPDGSVDLGPGARAIAIAAGSEHTCAVLDDGTVRCWGAARTGKLGYGNLNDIGDDEAPGSAGPVDLGPGRRATAITAGSGHTCAALDDGRIRCWGTHEWGAHGQYGHPWPIGDDETPGQRPPVNLDGMISVAPGVPLDVVAEWVGPGHVSLSWTAPDPGSAPISQYRITWARPGEIKHTQTATTTEPGAFLSGLYPGVYRFTVVASNAARSGPAATSNEVVVEDTEPPPPDM